MSLLSISPYIAWKGLATNSAIPSFSRPDLNSAGNYFKANPIKHWRKQLLPTANSGNRNRRAGVGIPSDIPGGAVYLGSTTNNTDCLANATSDTTGLKEYIDISGCNPCKRIRSATTIISKTYYADRASYLRSRNSLYNQRLTALPVPGVTYLDSAGDLLTVTTANAIRQTAECQAPASSGSGTPAACQTTIYKPSNAQYAKQGAVDSSDRITRLKINTVNKNAASYAAIFGSSASRYLGMASTPYFVKSKYQACVPMSLSGDKTICPV